MKIKSIMISLTVLAATMAGCGMGGAGDLAVSAYAPYDGESGVAVTAAIQVRFNRAIDHQTTLTPATFLLVSASGIAVSGEVTYEEGTRALIFTPALPLHSRESYQATIRAGIVAKDSTGGPGDRLQNDYVWRFTAALRPILYHSKRALDGSNAWNLPYSDQNIWAVDDATNFTLPLTETREVEEAHNTYPQWSPDGSRIVYTSLVPPAGGAAANPGDNIWVMDADGNDQRTLTATVAADVENQRPDWSPDGTKIVFDSNRALDGTDAPNVNGTENIWVMNADGTGLTALTQNTDGAHSAAPQWSPDGGRICFQSYLPLAQGGAPSRSYNIWVMDADGGNPAALTAVGIADAPSQFPRWSPDGSRVVFQSN
ncbi:MAG: Ig-like domain-containing protein, partial [bacterium]